MEVSILGYKINDITKKISLTRGDTLRLAIDIYDNNNIYTPSKNDSIRFAMKKTYASNVILIHKDISTDSMILTISPNDTKQLAFGTYVYDIEITFEDGDVDTFISGVFEILPEVE